MLDACSPPTAMEFYETEKCFRRYEEYILQAVINYPEEVRFEAQERSVNTETARCRDAIASWKANRWESQVDPAAYSNVLRNIRVKGDGNEVVIGPKRHVGEKVTAKAKDYLRTQMDVMIPMWAQLPADQFANLPIPVQKLVQEYKYKVLGKAEQLTTLPPMLERNADGEIEFKVDKDAVYQPGGEAPDLTYEQFQFYSIADAVKAIDEGKVSFTYDCPYSQEAQAEVIKCIGDRMNVAFTVKENSIHIF